MDEGQGQSETLGRWNSVVEQGVAGLTEMAEADFLGVGEAYGIEQFLSDPEEWSLLNDEEKRDLLQTVGQVLGVNMTTYSEAEVVRRFHEDGVPGQPSEGGAEVEVLTTSNSIFEVHVFRYVNPALGARYNLVRVH